MGKLWNRNEQEPKRRENEEQAYGVKSLKARDPRKCDDGEMGPAEGLRQLGASPRARWERDEHSQEGPSWN